MQKETTQSVAEPGQSKGMWSGIRAVIHRERQIPPITVSDSAEPAPLSFGQHRLWLWSQMFPSHPAYNTAVGLRFSGDLDVAALRASLDEVVRRHESLRTKFLARGDEPYQIVCPAGPVELETVDLQNVERSEREQALAAGLESRAAIPFDLADGLLIRATLFRLDPDEHVLCVIIHHISFDGASTRIFRHEILNLYNSFSSGDAHDLPELPVQYRDFARWQRTWLTDEDLAARIQKWRERWMAPPPMLDLPFDHPRPKSPTFDGEMLAFDLPADLVGGVSELARVEGCTLFVLLLAAFQTLIARYSGQDDIVFGSPVAGRNRAEIRDLVGFFANTMLIRTDLSGDPSFRELLGRVREEVAEAFAQQDIPVERLVNALGWGRDLGVASPFQVLFALQNVPPKPPVTTNVKWSSVPIDRRTAKFDLSLYTWITATGLHGLFEFSSDLFEKSTIQRMVNQFQKLLEGIVANPDEALSKLPLVTDDEWKFLVEECNRTDLPFPDDECMFTLFQERARTAPDAIALIGPDRTMTYGELDQATRRLAATLEQMGIGEGKLVGIYLDRSSWLVVGLFAVLLTGAAYVPLDPTYPPDRIEFILEDTSAAMVLSVRSLEADVARLGVPVVLVDELSLAEPGTQKKIDPASLAYLIYTSGSTGKPKAICIEHRNAVSLIHWTREAYSEEDLSGVFAGTSICFDMSIFEIFGTLAWGGRIILGENGLALSEWKTSDQVKLIDTVPSVIAELLRSDSIPQYAHTINLGGERLDPWLVDQLYALPWVDRVYDLYGPSETTTFSTRALRRPGGSPTIGKPIANTRIYILDSSLNPVSIGVRGEVYIAGKGITRGYWRRDDMTALRYVDAPEWMGEPRLYKTGDLGKYRPDGEIVYLGRVDDQVKVRGFRIELGEIEHRLLEHESVKEASVVVREDGVMGNRLVAYVSASGAEPLSETRLRKHLLAALPKYMAPAHFVFLDSLPLNANGKVDKLRLPEPRYEIIRGPEDEPQTEQEIALAEVWAQVLQIDRAYLHDDFFTVGGDSLVVMRLVAHAATRGFRFTAAQLVRNPTIAELAKVATFDGGAQVQPARREGAIPATPNTRHAKRAPIHAGYFSVATPDPRTLQRVAELLHQGTDSLCLRISDANEARIESLAVACDHEFVVEVQVPSLDIEGAIDDHVKALGAGLSYQEGPLLRIAVFRAEGCERKVVTLLIHGSACDEYSFDFVAEDFRVLATKLDLGEKSVALPARTTSFADYSSAMADYLQERWQQEPDFEAELDYWNAASLALVTPMHPDHPEQFNDPVVADSIDLTLPADTVQRLTKSIRATCGAHLQEALLAGFAVAIGDRLASPNLVIWNVTHGRSDVADVDVARTAGWLSSIYPVPLRADVSTPEAALRQTSAAMSGMPERSILYMWLLMSKDELVQNAIPAIPRPHVHFNHRGSRRPVKVAQDSDWRRLPPPPIPTRTAPRELSKCRLVYSLANLGQDELSVRLHFLELHYDAGSEAAMDILINGETAAKGYIPFLCSGGRHALIVFAVEGVLPDSEGMVEICLETTTRIKLSAIEVIDGSGEPVRRINVGGPAVGSFSGDGEFAVTGDRFDEMAEDLEFLREVVGELDRPVDDVPLEVYLTQRTVRNMVGDRPAADITVRSVMTEHGLHQRWTFNSTVHSRETMQVAADKYVQALERFAAPREEI